MTISLEEVLTKVPSRILNIVDTTLTRSLYVKLRRSKNHKSTKAINGTYATFHCPTKKSWEVANIKLEQERHIISRMIDCVEDEDHSTFFDIGGNIGGFSCFIGQNVDETIVFEPYEPNASLLMKNLVHNQIEHTVKNVAVGNVNDSTILNLPISEEPGTEQGTVLESHPLDHDFVKNVEVGIVRLDDFMMAEDLPSPDLVKIDVEGAAVQALKGMRKCLKIHKPDIFIEAHKNSEEIATFLKAFGYDLNYIFAKRNDSSPILVGK